MHVITVDHEVGDRLRRGGAVDRDAVASAVGTAVENAAKSTAPKKKGKLSPEGRARIVAARHPRLHPAEFFPDQTGARPGGNFRHRRIA